MPAHGGIIVYMLLELLEWGFDVPMEIGEGIQGKGEDDEERHAEEGDQKKQVFLVYIRVVIDQQADVRPVHFVNLAELPPAGTGGGAAVQFNTTIYKRAFSQNRFIAAVQHNIKTVGAQDSALQDGKGVAAGEPAGHIVSLVGIYLQQVGASVHC